MQIAEEAVVVFKSSLPEKTKDFILFILSQVTLFDQHNHEKLSTNAKRGVVEKIKEWHDSGSIYYEMTIKNGQRHGSFSMWDVKGKLICTMMFENGKINGLASLFKADGEEKIEFKHGCPILLDK
jgi:antitoxin component YwqK of YwqJK toxin-antitoxin module